MNDEDGVFVGAGTFKVDRARAIEVLRRWQLPDRFAGWLLWARCAAASGAESARFSWDAASVTLRFEGRPFSRAELDDPYAALFLPDSARTQRGRHFALGLLQALHCGAKEATVESGAGDERLRLRVPSLGKEAVEAAPGPESDTVLRAVWPWSSEDKLSFLGGAGDPLRTDPLLHPDRLAIIGAPNSTGGRLPERAFRFGAVSGRLGIPDYLTPPESHVVLYQQGVFAADHREPIALAKVNVWVNDDHLLLNASQSGVVRNRRFAGLMRYLAREATAFAEETARAHPALMARAASVLHGDSGAKAVWEQRLAWGPGGGPQKGPGVLNGLLSVFWEPARRRTASWAVVREAAEKTVWLRDVLVRTGHLGSGATESLVEALKAAPLLFGGDWNPLTLAQTDAMTSAELKLAAKLRGMRGT